VKVYKKDAGTARTGGHVEAAGLELAVLLAERAGLAAEVDAAVGAGLLREPVLRPQLGAVDAGVEAGAQPRHRRQQHVQRPAHAARCIRYILAANYTRRN